MSRISSTFKKSSALRSSQKYLGASYNDDALTKSLTTPMGQTNPLRSSGDKSLSRSMLTLNTVETEYIKNLQQQVYLLELETNYLREQAKKATDLHPHMTSEALRMIEKLKEMQEHIDRLEMELRRKEGNIDLVHSEKVQVTDRMREVENTFQREKRLLMDELINIKKQKEMTEADLARKDMKLTEFSADLDRMHLTLKNEENKIELFKNQFDQKVDQLSRSQFALEEAKARNLKLEAQVREAHERALTSVSRSHDLSTRELREEIEFLRQKLRENESSGEQERLLRSKVSDDHSQLVRENAKLHTQVSEFRNQLERERELRTDHLSRSSSRLAETAGLQEGEKRLQLEDLKRQLHLEQERVRHYMQLLSNKEQESSTSEFRASFSHSRLETVEKKARELEMENSELRRDKILLVDDIAALQKQVQTKENEILHLRTNYMSLDRQLGDSLRRTGKDTLKY